VIVSTGTLELGIDVGDLDRVIQIDAPVRVASFLQRLGRTGRRPRTVRNCLFLATEDDALVRAIALRELWQAGDVEHVRPPPYPLHLLAQQILALSLQEHGIGGADWPAWVGKMPGFAALATDHVSETLRHMLATQILWEESGVWSVGREGEKAFGRRHFLDLLSAFTTEPLFAVKHGEAELGRVHHASFVVRDDRPPVLLLAGRPCVFSVCLPRTLAEHELELRLTTARRWPRFSNASVGWSRCEFSVAQLGSTASRTTLTDCLLLTSIRAARIV
jgi:ATP-dependent Lhr-like helicase